MTVNREKLDKLGRFLLRGLRIGASTVSIVELLRDDWTGGCRSSARSLRTDSQLGVAGGQIQLPPEMPLRQQANQQLCGGAHQRARAEMTAITAPLLSAMAMWRWTPSGDRVPERLRISSSPWMVVASAAPAKRS